MIILSCIALFIAFAYKYDNKPIPPEFNDFAEWMGWWVFIGIIILIWSYNS